MILDEVMLVANLPMVGIGGFGDREVSLSLNLPMAHAIAKFLHLLLDVQEEGIAAPAPNEHDDVHGDLGRLIAIAAPLCRGSGG